MPAFTTLIEFRVPPNSLRQPGSVMEVCEKVKSCLASLDLDVVYDGSDPSGGNVHLHFVGSKASHATLRSAADDVITLDLHETGSVDHQQETHFTQEVVEDLEERLKSSMGAIKCRSLPALRRGVAVPCYFPTVDRKLIEYDFDACVLEQDSAYQNVKIMHSPQFGNMLILDDDPNLAESDLVYTQTITGHGLENYEGSTVLVLGGGDGGILHELLQQNPAFVTMVDIDEVVVRNAPKHLRGICHDALDSLSGNNYQVLIEDCVPIMKSYIAEGRQFDYVINDLTAIPCSPSIVDDQWDFLRLILDMSLQVLKDSGRYYTQGNSFNAPRSLGLYEDMLNKLHTPVQFSKQEAFVPSYHEKWVFYKIWKYNTQDSAIE